MVFRLVQRHRTLPPFRCTLDDVEELCGSLIQQLNMQNPIVSLSVSLRDGSLSASSVADLRSYTRLPERLDHFTLTIVERPLGGSATLRTEDADGIARAQAAAHSEAWCAAAVEVISAFAKHNQRRWPILWLLAHLTTDLVRLLPVGLGLFLWRRGVEPWITTLIALTALLIVWRPARALRRWIPGCVVYTSSLPTRDKKELRNTIGLIVTIIGTVAGLISLTISVWQ